MTAQTELGRRRFTKGEVLRMLEVGILDASEPVELIEGELVVVSPQGAYHRTLAIILRDRLIRAYGERVHVQDHSPIDAGPYSLPEPDVAVVRGPPEAYLARLPTGDDVVLVVEIAVTGLRLARQKIGVYAGAGVPVYWLFDIDHKTVEVFSSPTSDGTYRDPLVLGPEDRIAVPELDLEWPVAELLP